MSADFWEPGQNILVNFYSSKNPFITWLEFGEILLQTFWGAVLIWMCFFKVKHPIGLISGMGGPIDMNWKGGASVGYWVNCVPLTFDLTHDLDLFLRSSFKIAVSQELLVWRMWNENKANQLDTRPTTLPCILTTPMTLTLKFQVQSLKWPYFRHGRADWVDHSWPWAWPLYGWGLWMCRGDFRHWRAIDISSLLKKY